jgi:hypothetical protein
MSCFVTSRYLTPRRPPATHPSVDEFPGLYRRNSDRPVSPRPRTCRNAFKICISLEDEYSLHALPWYKRPRVGSINAGENRAVRAPSAPTPSNADLVNAAQTETELAALRNSVRCGCPIGEASWSDQNGAATGTEDDTPSPGASREALPDTYSALLIPIRLSDTLFLALAVPLPEDPM